MAGTALTDTFMLGTATVMVGPAEDLFDLNPAEHSIGLVKNFTISSDPSYTELTQGVKNTIVFSTMTANPARATMEAYEYTSKNIALSLGIEGATDLAALSVSTLTNGATSPIDNTVPVDSATGITVGMYVMFDVNGDDHVLIRKVTAVNTNILTVSPGLTEALPDNTPVRAVNIIGGGSKTDQPYYSCAVVGKLANNEQVVLLLPKVRIVKGFNMAFTSDNYGNLPIELTMYDLVATDTFYSEFAGDQFRIVKQK